MKSPTLFAISLFLLCAATAGSARAGEFEARKIREFTALAAIQTAGGGPTELWAAGIERNSARTNVHPFIERIRGGKRLHRALPAQLASREVQAFWSASHEKKRGMAFLSQWTIEQGDAPQLHFVPQSSKTAFKLAEAPCLEVLSLRKGGKDLVFLCGDGHDEGRKPEEKKVPFPPELEIPGLTEEATTVPVRRLTTPVIGTALLPDGVGRENVLELSAPEALRGKQKPRIVRPLTR
jgi:hypothetical protein